MFWNKKKDLIDYGKNYFIYNNCKRKEITFYNFIPKLTRDNLAKKYYINDNETNSLQTETLLLSPNSSNISILFMTQEQSNIYIFPCSLNDTFTSIENKLYHYFSALKFENKYFYVMD